MTASTVVIACDTFAPDHNGTATFAKNLSIGLRTKGVEVHVIAPASSRLYGTFREVHDGVPLIVHRLKSRRLPFQPTQRFVVPFGLTKKMEDLLSVIKPDLVHIQSHINIGHHAALAAKKANLKVVATNHIDTEAIIDNVLSLPKFVKDYLSKWLLSDAGRVLRQVDAVVASTTESANRLSKATGIKNVETISGGVRIPQSFISGNLNPDRNQICYLGRLDREKHVYVLIAAMARLQDLPSVKLKLIGEGSQSAELQRLVSDLGLNSKIDFLGALDDAKAFEVVQNSGVFVMPSTQELQSMANLEAMALGRPVVAAHAGAVPELVVNGENGKLYTPDKPGELAKAVRAILELPNSEYNRLSSGAKATAKKHNFENTLAGYLDVYSAVQNQSLELEPRLLGSLALGKAANGVLEQLDGAKGEAFRTFSEIRFTIEGKTKKASKTLSASLRKAINRIRND